MGASFPLSATWSRNNQVYKYCGDATDSCTLTVPAVGSGHLLAIAVTYNKSEVSISSATGAASAWVHPDACKAFVAGYQAIDWIYALSATGGTSIRVALSGKASYVDAFYFEYSGTSPFRFESCSIPAHGTSSQPTSGKLTTQGANDLAIAIVKGDKTITPDSVVAASPWSTHPIFASGGEAITDALNLASTRASSATFTASAPSNFVGIAISFKDASRDSAITRAATSGTTGFAMMAQIADDMGPNEAHPEGARGFGFYSGSVISDGNNPYASQPKGAGAIDYWGTVYVDENGNKASNTRVAIRNCGLHWKRASTGAWTSFGPDLRPGDVGDYPENFQGVSTPTNFRIEPDGSMSVKPGVGKTSHWYGPYPRVAIDRKDFAGVVSLCEVRLVVDDSSRTDDRQLAKYLVNVGADFYPTTTGPGIANNPGIGGSKFKKVSTRWRSVAMTTLSLSELQANPPPIKLPETDVSNERTTGKR